MIRRLALPLALIAIGAAAIVALRAYNARTAYELSHQTWVPKPVTITPEIELLQQYVRIDTSRRNEIDGARFLAGILEKNGVRAEIIESAPGRASVYARIRGKGAGDGLLLLNHIDVVPAAPEGWTRPPFAAGVLLDQLYGRGTLDMKGIAVCELLAFLDVARSHRTPERDLVFLATADEEHGGALGVAWLLEHRPDVFAGIRYAINEGGITETTQERITYFGIEVGTKMVVKARLRASSRDALLAVRRALEPYMLPDDATRVLPEVREFFRDLAPVRTEQGQLLGDIDRTVATGKVWLLVSGYRELLQNNVAAEGVQTDARGATMLVTLFNLPDERPEARLAWLRSMVAPLGATIDEVVEQSGPAPLSNRHTPMFALIGAEAARRYDGARVGCEILSEIGNDSRYLRARGIDAYGLMPFATDWYETQAIHGVDERLRVNWFGDGVALVRSIVRRHAFEPLPPAR